MINFPDRHTMRRSALCCLSAYCAALLQAVVRRLSEQTVGRGSPCPHCRQRIGRPAPLRLESNIDDDSHTGHPLDRCPAYQPGEMRDLTSGRRVCKSSAECGSAAFRSSCNLLSWRGDDGGDSAQTFVAEINGQPRLTQRLPGDQQLHHDRLFGRPNLYCATACPVLFTHRHG